LHLVVTRGVQEESGCLLLRRENETAVLERDDAKLVTLFNAIFVLEGHGAMAHESLLLGDDLGCLVVTITLRDVTLVREVKFQGELHGVCAEDSTLISRGEVVEEVLVKNAVLNTVGAVDELLMDLPGDGAHVAEL
jgi:hypothetical protein